MKHLRIMLPVALAFCLMSCNSPKKADKQSDPAEKQITLETLKQGAATATADDEPATAADIEHLYQVLKIRDQIKQITEIMSHQIGQLIQEAAKEQPSLPPEAEKRLGALYEKIVKNMPTEELLQAMAPIYEKYFTKSDIDAIVAFYSSPAGKKMVNQTPEITQEAMQATMTIMQTYMKKAMEQVYEELNELQKASPEQKDGKGATAYMGDEDEGAMIQEEDRTENP